ncbi:MAG TPA: hypothetical protein VM120_12655 [Bryobacteraceae bacterium]|nr:hypothetical protein [Bryobacteraceae bacterium]
MRISRRDAFGGLAGGVWLVNRADAQVTPELVKLRPEIEPLAALIERTPREKCAEMAVEQLRRGVSYRQFLAALFLAGVRNVNPRPPGFALHCVFIIHSAHLLGMEAPSDCRLFPLFFALDDFKAAQERDARAKTGDYTMRPIQGPLPSPERAATDLIAALEAWDIERAERAVVSLARHRRGPEIFHILWRYGARDYRNIGHKAIYAANAYRTLHTIGWQHSEPVLRSLVLSLLDFGKEQTVNGYALADQCYEGNLQRVKESFPRLPATWTAEQPDKAATRGMLRSLATATPAEVCTEAASRLAKGVAATAIWDAVHLAAAELKMRVRGGAAITGIHTVTSANALHYAYLASHDPQTRYMLTLQAAGWMSQFRKFAEEKPENVRAFPITGLEPFSGASTVEDIVAGIPSKVDECASRVLTLAGNLHSRQEYLSTAVRLALTRSNEVHYYKYLASLMEDIPLVSPEWQPHLLAATVYYLKGSGDPEASVIKRAREVMKSL